MRYNQWDKARVLELMDSGLSRQEVEYRTGVSEATIRRWMDPEGRAKTREYNKRYREGRTPSELERIARCVAAGRSEAEKRGYKPVNLGPVALEKELEQQDGCCKICGDDHKKLVIEHCHDTGDFRGWVCQRCNNLVTLAEQGIVEKVLDYLAVPMV